jgi:hypothetical protein
MIKDMVEKVMVEKVIEKAITNEAQSRNGSDDRSDHCSARYLLAIVLSVGAFGIAVLQQMNRRHR